MSDSLQRKAVNLSPCVLTTGQDVFIQRVLPEQRFFLFLFLVALKKQHSLSEKYPCSVSEMTEIVHLGHESRDISPLQFKLINAG